MKIYHVIYEPSFQSLTLHHWTDCNLSCRGCFCNVEKLDFSLFPDAISRLKTKPIEEAPSEFIESIAQLRDIIGDFSVKRVVCIGKEPSLDPNLPQLLRFFHDEYQSYNVLLTNGVYLCEMKDVDEVIVSIKAVSDDIYQFYTGKSNVNTLKNFITMYEMGKKIQAECLFIPSLIEKDEIGKIARFIANVDPSITLRIDGYFEIPGQVWRSATTDEVVEASKEASKYLKTVNYLTADSNLLGTKPLRLFG